MRKTSGRGGAGHGRMKSCSRRAALRGAALAVFALLAGLSGAVEAQNPAGQTRPRGQEMTRPELEARLRAAMERSVRENLGLTEEEFQAMQERLEPFRESRRELAGRERATRMRMAAFFQDGGREGEAEQLLADLVQIREDELALFKEELDALGDLLTPEQRLQYLLLRERGNQRVRDVQRRMGGPGGPPVGGGPPGGGIDASRDLW